MFKRLLVFYLIISRLFIYACKLQKKCEIHFEVDIVTYQNDVIPKGFSRGFPKTRQNAIWCKNNVLSTRDHQAWSTNKCCDTGNSCAMSLFYFWGQIQRVRVKSRPVSWQLLCCVEKGTCQISPLGSPGYKFNSSPSTGVGKVILSDDQVIIWNLMDLSTRLE